MPEATPEILPPETPAERTARLALGATLIFAGTSHLTFARRAFRAQVPPWLPMKTDNVVLESGIAEIALGSAIAFLPESRRKLGWFAAAFFAAVFPGNIAQYTRHRSAFGLNTDGKRFARLFFQPVLIGWALWATGALRRKQNQQLPASTINQ